MKRNKIRKKIDSLNIMVKEHNRKIETERQKSFPDEGCIKHWEKEMIAFKNQIEKALRKMEG